MIDITEKEFLRYLEQYANKEISMKYLIGKLETDYRTLHNKIIKVSITNPDLYYKIVTSNPYTQKTRTDIDFEALMVYIIKNSITIAEAVDTFNISRKTIQRRVEEIKSTNKDLYDLFKISVGKNKKLLDDPIVQQKIEMLEYKDVVIGEINEDREKYLLDLEKRFNFLIDSGLTREQAANELGHGRDYINKALNELYRLKIEKEISKKDKQKEFRNSLSDMSQYSESTEGQVLNKSNQAKDNQAR